MSEECNFNRKKLAIIEMIVNENSGKVLSLIETLLDKDQTYNIEEVEKVLCGEKCWLCYKEGGNKGCKECL